jgi:tetratricopeptide (TPR) repeat protein
MEKTKSRKQNKKKIKHRISIFTWLAIFMAGVLTLLCALFFILRWSLNAWYVAEAKKGVYHSEVESLLTLLNVNDGYVIWYNIGNYHYENGDYDEAEIAYLKAIECGIPYEKECPVKVNLALCTLAQISEDEWDAFFDCTGPRNIDALSRRVEKTLLEARDILTEDECAHEDDENGHDEQAQLLKDEIDELLEESDLDQENGSGEENNTPANTIVYERPDEDGDDDYGTDISIDEEEIMDHIQELLDENEGERTDDQQFYSTYYGIDTDSDIVIGAGGEVW